MYTITKLSAIAAFALQYGSVLAYPSVLALRTDQHINARDEGRVIPPAPERPPELVEANDRPIFHGSRFDFFDEISSRIGFLDNGGHPAVIHAPVFLYGRPSGNLDPCYPEGATNAKGDSWNPGSGYEKGTADYNPGEDCMNPGDYHGDYSEGNAFPLYVGASWCGGGNNGDGEWRMDYDVYYVQDGNLSAGHRHDWEGVTIVFKRANKAGDRDWWAAAGVIYRTHGDRYYYDWKDVMSVSGKNDIKEEKIGNNKNHPKVFVGFFSHASYRKKSDSSNGGSLTNAGAGAAQFEYRSSDWYRLPNAGDLKLWSTIPSAWDGAYGAATGTPSKNKNSMCGWEIKAGPINPGSGGW